MGLPEGSPVIFKSFKSCYHLGFPAGPVIETPHFHCRGPGFSPGCVVATRSRKQTHSEGQCRQWSAVYYTGGPKAESPLSQGSRPVFVKTLYTLSVRVQTSISPKSPETSLNKDKRKIQSQLTISDGEPRGSSFWGPGFPVGISFP